MKLNQQKTMQEGLQNSSQRSDAPTFDQLITLVTNWAQEKDLMKSWNASRQMLKVTEEVGELAGSIAKSKEEDTIDALGDTFVTLIILAGQLGIDPTHALNHAYNVIKNRTGKTVDGVFVKNS